MIVAIDGPAGAGKSSVARALAEKINFQHLDSGAFYRCYAWKSRKLKLNLEKSDELQSMLDQTKVEADYESEPPRYFVDGEDVSKVIRSNEISRLVSSVSKERMIREAVVHLLRQVSNQGDFIVDGRDIGSIVFPDASIKFFLTASIEERAMRRHKELLQKGESINLEELKQEIQKRDFEDSQREIAPLIQPEDAILIDSTHMNLQEVLNLMAKQVQDAAGCSDTQKIQMLGDDET